MSKVKRIIATITVLALLIVLCTVPISADENRVSINKRALVISAPYEVCLQNSRSMGQASVNCMYSAFFYNEIDSDWYVVNPIDSFSSVSADIQLYFGGMTNNDICYIYLHCHEDEDGNLFLFGRNKAPISILQLKQTLNNLGGHVVLFLDSCFSGLAIQSQTTGNFCEPKFTVFCSTEYNHESHTYNSGLSYAAESWAATMGYHVSDTSTGYGSYSPYSTASNFGIISASEYFNSSNNTLHVLYYPQTMCYYSASPYYSVFFTSHPRGDVFTNNIIDSSDILRLRAFLTGSVSLTTEQINLADMNHDGVVTMADVSAIQSYINAMS